MYRKHYNLVNNYEISVCELFYLKIWSYDTTKSYISSRTLLYELGFSDSHFLSKYFDIYDGKVDISVFIEFVIIFTFFSDGELVSCIII